MRKDPCKNRWFRSETFLFSPPPPHPFSRETPKALRSLTIERLVARDGALCIRVTVILHCLQEAFLMEGCLVTRNTVRAHRSSRPVTLYSGFTIASLSPFKMAKRKSRRRNPVPRFYFSPLARIDPSRGY